MRRYMYSYVYCTCATQRVGITMSGAPRYIGNGNVKFFECHAGNIIEADKLLAAACDLKKINWSEEPFIRVVCWFEER